MSQQIFSDVVSFIFTPDFHGWLLIVKAVFLVLSLIMILATVWLVKKCSWLSLRYQTNLSEFFSYKAVESQKFLSQWNKIKNKLQSANAAEYKIAIIEADGLLGEALQKMGLAGETLADKLSQLTSSVLPNLSEVEAAHKIHDDIVHDPDYRLSLEGAREVLNIYGEAFGKLGMF